MRSFETLKVERTGRILTLTLNRPEQGNAFDIAMTRELRELWEQVKFDDETSVIVVTGAGTRHFCTGVDFKQLEKSELKSRYATRDEGVRHLSPKHVQCWKPVIAAVNGGVVGGGFHFITAADITIAAETATFFDTHVEINLLPAFEPIELQLRMPREAVSRMFLLGRDERMTAQRAYELGLVSEVVPQEKLLPRAMELAEILVQRDLSVLMATVELMHKSRECGTTLAIKQALALREVAGWSPLNNKRR